ncbi:SufS family cysteine desulfurase [Candidatus Peregrinibacteria bacterium]|jgi:cysteine desulfurase / selenocysteine lyase|nr:SufS family cysteine desulfurase [Candidatus Peregrinibacteria bacterium]MBT7484326.1 SufS family cysteine desulfurase [Candidatus Peregrinibacteria bacterium]MBT7702745.1 SufS family cysteine desulfurase [Candidatus Peregrinibacteria bacterium]
MISRFPFFKENSNVVYLDSAATTQRVDVALGAEMDFYTKMNANVHRGLYPMAEEATEKYEAVREIVRVFLNAPSSDEVVFTRGTTESLNLVAQGYGGMILQEGDEILLTIMEHHSNLVPWQMVVKQTGAKLRFVDLDEEFKCNDQTKIVAVTGLSNTLGQRVDLKKVVAEARRVGAIVVLDAAQMAAHLPIDVQKLGVDFVAFSSHKMYGPTGAGVLWGRRELLEKTEPIMGGGDMIREVYLDHSTWNDVPYKFESGTPNIAQVLGMGAAIEFLREVGFDKIQAHDEKLMKYLKERLSELDFVKIFGDEHVGILSFIMDDIHNHDVAAILGEKGICVRAGHHCTMPLMQKMGIPGTTRVSFGIYNTEKDVDDLMTFLKEVANKFAR